LKRIFIFSYHGRDTYQTGFNRLLSMAEHLSQHYEVHFIYGNKTKIERPVKIKGKLIETPLNYSSGIFHSIYKKLLESGRRKMAKLLLITYYFFRKREIFDLGREFNKYKKKTNLSLNPTDVVLVSFPSIAVHNLGYALQQEFGCKLILDYRDPGVFGYQMIEENRLMSFLRRFFLKRNELRNMKSADLVVTISESIKNLFPDKYNRSIQVIRNGFDINKINFSLIEDHPHTFKLVYLGSVYNDQLYHTYFFKCVRRFIDQLNVQPQNFQLRFVGTGESIMLKDIIRQYNLEPYTYVSSKMPIEQVYSELYSASMFFHLKYGNRKEIITSKQYDYLAFQKPILLPEDDEGDISQSIRKYKAGYVCKDENELTALLTKVYKAHFEQPERILRTAEELYELSRQSQEDKLLGLINNL